MPVNMNNKWIENRQSSKYLISVYNILLFAKDRGEKTDYHQTIRFY